MGFISDKTIELLVTIACKIVIALIVYFVGKFVIKKVCKLLLKGKLMSKTEPTTRNFALSAVNVVLYIILIISIVGILGIPMASIITVLATAGAAVGLALQGSLSNLAGGIMLIINKPFKVGDYITAAGESGVVKAIMLFYTKLTTWDNKDIMIPNGSLMNSNVTNYSSQALRRVDVQFTCARGENVQQIRDVIAKIQQDDPRILSDPAPYARLSDATNEALVFTTRSWVKNEDFWPVNDDLIQNVTDSLASAGIKSPAVRIVTCA